MLIGKRWRISSDSLNLSIEEKRRIAAKDGKPSHINWYPRAYFSPTENGFKNALIYLRDQGVTSEGLKDIKSIIQSIEQSTETITKALRSLESHEELIKGKKVED